MILYLDTSALVKRYVRETGSQEVVALIKQADTVGAVVLTQVEMAATLAKAARQKWVERKDAESAWQDFLDHWLSFTRLALTPAMLERTSRLAWEYGLRGYDALHFSAVLTWQDTLETPVTLATFDRELWLAAENRGVLVWPEGLYS